MHCCLIGVRIWVSHDVSETLGEVNEEKKIACFSSTISFEIKVTNIPQPLPFLSINVFVHFCIHNIGYTISNIVSTEQTIGFFQNPLP